MATNYSFVVYYSDHAQCVHHVTHCHHAHHVPHHFHHLYWVNELPHEMVM